MPKQYLNIDSFARGINNVKNPRDLSIGESPSITNFDITHRGELRPRGKFEETTNDGESYEPGSNAVPTHTASLNPGHGLHYFEYDDETAVAGFSLTGISPSGAVLLGSGGNAMGADDGTSSNYYIGFLTRSDTQPATQLAKPTSNWIAIGASTGLLTHANNKFLNDITASSMPIKIVVSGTSNNNGTFTVLEVASGYHTGGGGGNFIANYGGDAITIKAGTAPTLLRIEEDLTHEAIEAGTTVTFKRVGIQDDIAILLGNTDDSKIDVYKDGAGSYTADAINLETIATASTYPDWVFYSVNGAVRVADGNRQNISKPKWYGYIKKDMFYAAEAGASSNVDSFISHSVASALYQEDNDLAKPSGGNFIASGSVDGSNEFAMTDGTGWSVSVAESTVEGMWEEATYEFGSTFIYDGNQESLIYRMSTTFAANGLKKLLINVFANHNPGSASTTYSNRITGGRIYIRENGSSDDWTMLADMSIKDGARTSLLGEYNQWVQDSSTAGSGGDQHFRITIPTDTTLANRGTSYWQIELDAPSLETYASLNGFRQSTKQISFGQSGASYGTATIANRRAFVANVKYDEGGSGSLDGVTEFSSYGDRIMYSEIGRYDTFPNLNYIEASKGDAENYVRLESYADRILAFKQRTMQVINVASPSPANWFIEDTIYSAGVTYPYSVSKGEAGVVWANKSGIYYYDGSSVRNVRDGKISDDDWATFSAETTLGKDPKRMTVGYIPVSNQALIIQDTNAGRHGYIYDIRNDAITYADDIAPNAYNDTATNGASFTPTMSNFINDSRNRLVVAYDVASTDLGGEGANKVYLTYYKIGADQHKDYTVQTPDFTFGQPSLVKKFYKLFVHYQHTSSTLIPAANIYYQINQNGTWTAMSTGSFIQADGVYRVAVFEPASAISFNSIMFKVAIVEGTNSWDTDTKLYINDMQVEYRVLRLKQASAG